MTSPRFLLAGARPGAAAGNSASTEVALEALRPHGHVDLLTHVIAILPRWTERSDGDSTRITLGTQPFAVHGEALLGGRLHRRRLRAREYMLGWVVNSRYAGALAAANIPYVIWEPTPIRDELRVVSARAVRRAGRGTGVGTVLHSAFLLLDERLERAAYRRAAVVLAMSAYARDRIVEIHRLAPDHVRVLQHPPTRAFIQALARQGGGDGRRPRAAGGPLRLLFVGRVDDPRKHFDLLLEAYFLLQAEGACVSLDVIGPASAAWQRRMAGRIAETGITLLGQVGTDALAAAYRSHDLLVVPSRQEGFGIVVAEALHAGLPVVATRCGGPEETLRDSQAGLVTGHSASELASAIRRVGQDETRWMECSARGVRFAREMLSPDRFDAAVGEIIQQLGPQPHARVAPHAASIES